MASLISAAADQSSTPAHEAAVAIDSEDGGFLRRAVFPAFPTFHLTR
jgi:hypothetical protein